MVKRTGLLMLAVAAVGLTLASADDAQAFFGRRGGSEGSSGGCSGSYGSSGGSSGSYGSSGSHGGRFFRHRHSDSCGSYGGQGSCGESDSCGELRFVWRDELVRMRRDSFQHAKATIGRNRLPTAASAANAMKPDITAKRRMHSNQPMPAPEYRRAPRR